MKNVQKLVQSLSSFRRDHLPVVLAASLYCFCSSASAQGTITANFNVLPPGQEGNVGIYYESGISFAPIGPGNVALAGPGLPNHPDNGTGFLEIPDGSLAVSFTNSPTTYFNLVSFDGAEFSGFGPQTLEVIGYKPMAGTVTNYFTVNSLSTFQTFTLDSSFSGLYQVDVLNARWSLDNFVVSGVPEPSCGALIVLGVVCGIVRTKAGNWRKR